MVFLSGNNSSPDSYFRKCFTKWMASPLKEYGFKRYKANSIGRVTTDGVFQLLLFQKSSYGDKTFKVNVIVRSLYIPHEYLVLKPGQGLGFFKYSTDSYWTYKTENMAEINFQEVNGIIFDNVLSWFKQTMNQQQLINLYTNKVNEPFLPQEGWRDFELAHLYARNNEYEKALASIKKAFDLFNSLTNEWSKDAAINCEKFLFLLESDQNQIPSYLSQCEEKSRANLGLINW